MKTKHVAIVQLVLAAAVFAWGGTAGAHCVSGVYPRLALSNDEGECGTGAVVPWAGDLWVVTYGPHCPVGSSDKLYRIRPDLTREVFPGSVGGTPANRMIHRETNQLLIGPYVIDANGNVRTVPPAKMPGRLTGAARHLADPANKVYVATMETGLYELDMRTLYVSSETEFAFDVQVDERGDGNWRRVERLGASTAGNAATIVPLDGERGEWIRIVAKKPAKRVTAFFNYANEDRRSNTPDPIFAGIGGMTTQMGDCEAVVRCGDGDGDLKLQLMDVTCNSRGDCYEMGGDLKLRKVAESGSRQAEEMRRKCRVQYRVVADGEGVTAEKASILIVHGGGVAGRGGRPVEVRQAARAWRPVAGRGREEGRAERPVPDDGLRPQDGEHARVGRCDDYA